MVQLSERVSFDSKKYQTIETKFFNKPFKKYDCIGEASKFKLILFKILSIQMFK